MERRQVLVPLGVFVSTVLFFLLFDSILGALLNKKIIGQPHPYYHHGLLPNAKMEETWGHDTFSIYTNTLGLRDGSNREIELKSTKQRIVFLGDSFVEGVGLSYEKTFVGLVAKALDPRRFEVLNAAVVSYSPKLYFLKAQYLVEHTGLQIDELVVYIDISDPQDEIVYQPFIPATAMRRSTRFDMFLKRHSYVYNRFYAEFNHGYLYLRNVLHPSKLSSNNTPSPLPTAASALVDFYSRYYEERWRWVSDPVIMEKWGKTGLLLCRENMDRLYALCQAHGIHLVIAVYPWPQQVKRHEIDSLQVTFWKSFCAEKKIPFLNYFPDFMKSPNPQEDLDHYFIDGDVHWNEQGHQLIAHKFLQNLYNK